MGHLPLAESYMVLIEFLMLSKRQVLELGAQQGLTGMQTMTLILLEKPRSMSEFKNIFNCDAGNVTGIIDGLEQKQLVSRFENRSDRRLKYVRLSTAGKRMRTTLLRKLARRDNPPMSQLSDHEFTTFINLLSKITASSST